MAVRSPNLCFPTRTLLFRTWAQSILYHSSSIQPFKGPQHFLAIVSRPRGLNKYFVGILFCGRSLSQLHHTPPCRGLALISSFGLNFIHHFGLVSLVFQVQFIQQNIQHHHQTVRILSLPSLQRLNLPRLHSPHHPSILQSGKLYRTSSVTRVLK